MSKRTIAIFLTIICAIGFGLRTIYASKDVFAYGYVNFIETDAWNRMMYAKQIAGMNFFESIGFTIQHNLLFSFIVGTLGRFLPIEYVGAWLPPVLSIGVVVTVYFIGRYLFNNIAGLLSALFVAILPSEFLHRSTLGFADHHVTEVLFLSLVMLFLIKAIQQPQVKKWYVLAGVSACLYFINNHGGMYLLGGLLIALLVALVAYNLKQKEKWYSHSLVIIVPALIGLALYLPFGGWRELLFLVPGSNAMEVTTTQEIAQGVFTPLARRTISEQMPLFFPHRYFDPAVVLTNLHLFFLTFIGGVILLWKQRKERVIILLALWTLVVFALTLNERRFLYYFSINVALLSGLCVYWIATKIKGGVFQNAVMAAMPLLVITLPLAKGVATPGDGMPIKWHEALVWLDKQPAGVVTSWGDYGHWIQYVTDKPSSYLPGPGGDLAAKIFLATNPEDAKQYLDKLKTRYLIVDELLLKQKYYALEIYANLYPPNRNATLGYQLYFQNKIPPFLKLVYENSWLRIFAYASGN